MKMDMETNRVDYQVCLGTAQSQLASIPMLLVPLTILEQWKWSSQQ